MRGCTARIRSRFGAASLFVILLVALWGPLAARLSAQSYSIDWFKIAGGGGTSAGSTYSLNGTLGQPDTAVMTGGNFGLVGGFWSFIAAVPAPGIPALTFMLSQTNTILVCWPSSSINFVLQQNADLGSTNWVNVGAMAVDNGSIKCVTISPTPGSLFFRLKK